MDAYKDPTAKRTQCGHGEYSLPMTSMAQQAVPLRDAASAAVGLIGMYKVSRYMLNLERFIKAACNDFCPSKLAIL
jgi:hypothetical protein